MKETRKKKIVSILIAVALIVVFALMKNIFEREGLVMPDNIEKETVETSEVSLEDPVGISNETEKKTPETSQIPYVTAVEISWRRYYS